jgi:hypothetical protein
MGSAARKKVTTNDRNDAVEFRIQNEKSPEQGLTKSQKEDWALTV